MKKLIALGLAACMTFSLAGCSGSAGKETEAASAAETTAADFRCRLKLLPRLQLTLRHPSTNSPLPM